RLRVQRRQARQGISAAVTASRTTLTALFGVGPIVAATVIGEVGDISRFPTPDRFAAYNGTAPIEVSSGERRRKVFRLSLRGHRPPTHATHMDAIPRPATGTPTAAQPPPDVEAAAPTAPKNRLTQRGLDLSR